MPAVVHSEPIRALLQLAQRVAASQATVLITGESGVGKELIARSIHHFSPRAAHSWVDVSCATLPDNLVESELFGYEKGAFSGAMNSKPGFFEMANHGTLFLDEIGELDLRMQSKLLRVLDGSPFYRLGSTKKTQVDVRIVAATNKDLLACVKTGQFREDLYHRLCQVTIHVPPLRERKGDIVPLAQFFLSQQPGTHRFSSSALDTLQQYHWPGNIRELRNVVMKACIWATEEELKPSDLQLELMPAPILPELNFSEDRHFTHSPRLESLERETILRVLARAGGHQQRAAQMLGISRRTLSRRLKAYQHE